MSSPGKTISEDEWKKKMEKVQVRKEDLDRLVMNYLVIEGYRDAAEQFSQECGLPPTVDLKSVQDRKEIRNAIQQGDIDAAIDLVNDLNPEILDTNPGLFFHLQQQRLIELIRRGEHQQALEFAAEEMAPRGEEHPEFLKELERTMALLAFENVEFSPVSDLLQPGQRQKTAGELNAAILKSQSKKQEPTLPHLLKSLAWAQDLLDETHRYPRMNDFVKAELVVGGSKPDSVDDDMDISSTL